jgi:hypothetical protein
MIIVHLMGGLGNQLFQYAAARRLSAKYQTSLKFDTESFKHDKLRDFALNPFFVIGEKATECEITQVKSPKYFFVKLPALHRLLPAKFKSTLRAPTFKFYKEVLNGGSSHYLYGYWANENYFKDIRPILLQELRLKPDYQQSDFRQAQAQLLKENSVSIHIRRGDYANSATVHSFFGLLPLAYYQRAIKLALQQLVNPVFYLFTDDVEWVKENLNLEVPIIFVKNMGDFKDYHELMLMASCKHNIIANSTFSWWGAWLNDTPDKLVIAPKIWYSDIEAQKFYQESNFIPSTWIKV